jgi:UDP-3-O-[3-hydroxymyristoyl] N-acetylglucosamine deacetylase
VELAPCDGPAQLAQRERRAPLGSLSVAATDGAVRVRGGGVDIELVEHFLAAMAGLGIRDGVVATVDGPEFPLLDGGALAFTDALLALRLPRQDSSLRVARAGTLTFGESTYTFDVAPSVELSVEVAFAHPAIGRQEATWRGDPADFRERIAGARTFGFAADAARLRQSGRAKLCWSEDPAARRAAASAVVIYGETAPSVEGPLPSRDEAARHKLLDLIGDLSLYGGPPKGRVRAVRPGHAATHYIVPKALLSGLLSRG